MRRCGGALTADQLGHVPMGEADRDDGSLSGHATKPVRQMPEQHQEAQLDVLQAVNGDVERQRVERPTARWTMAWMSGGHRAPTVTRRWSSRPSRTGSITRQLTSNGSGA